MPIKTNQVIRDLGGNALTTPEGEEITIGAVVINALLSSYNDEPALSGIEKLKRFQIAERFAEDEVEPSNQDAAEIERLVAKAYGPLVVGRVYKALERPTQASPIAS